MKQKARVTVIKRRIEAWLMALAMVLSVVMIPGGVAKADSNNANVEFYDAVLDSEDAEGKTLLYTIGNKNVKVQLGKMESDTFVPVVFKDHINGNNRYEINCEGVIDYYLYVDNSEGADYSLNVAGDDESVDDNGFFRLQSAGESGVISVWLKSVNQGSGIPGGNDPLDVAIKKGNEAIPLIVEGKVSEAGKAYVLTEEEDDTGNIQRAFPEGDRACSGIGLIEDNGSYNIAIDGIDGEKYLGDSDIQIFINSGNALITCAGQNILDSIVLGDGVSLELRPGDPLPGGSQNDQPYPEVSEEEYPYPVTEVDIWNGIFAPDGKMANRVAFRDDVFVVVGDTDYPTNDAYKNIRTVELYNYDFHKKDTYNNNEIFAENAFTNVETVELYYSLLYLEAKNLFSSDDSSTTKGTLELFQEAVFDYNDNMNIQEGAKVVSRYYDHYPDNSKPFEGRTKNAGIIAYDETDDKGELYIQTYDLVPGIKANTPVKDDEHHYTLENDEDSNSHSCISSTDPIIYSVMYNVDDEGDGSKELSYITDDGNEKTITLENGNCGQVEMKNFEKGYYIKDGSRGKFEAWIAAGEPVDVIIMPDAGYQYVGNTLNINGEVITDVIPSEDNKSVGQYSFTMNKNAGHISAGFIKTDDVVDVASGTAVSNVLLSGTENIVERGNVKLDVDGADVGDNAKLTISSVVEDMSPEMNYEYDYEYLDLTLNEYVVKNYNSDKETQDAWETPLTELEEPVTITMDIPDSMMGASFYKVVRLHDDAAENLKTDCDYMNNTLSFETDRFSTYAIVAERLGGSSDEPYSGEGLNYSTPSSGTVKLEGTTVTIENAVISSGELCLFGKDYGKTPMTLIVKGTNSVEYLIFDTAVKVICEKGASLTFDASKSALDAVNEWTGTKGSYTLGTDTVLEGNVFKYKGSDSGDAGGSGDSSQTDPAGQDGRKPEQSSQTDSSGQNSQTSNQPKPAEVGATITDTSTGGSSTAAYTVSEKSTGAGDAGEVAYTGESADSTATAVTIPATVTGADGTVYEVTKVADNALKDNKTVKEVTVGDNIEEIGAGAFQNATNLTTVKLGKKVAKIDKNSFAGCTKLKKVTSSGGALTSIGESAFKGDKALTSVDFSKSKVKTIGKNAFNGDKKLNTIKLNGNAITKVGKGAFKNIKKKATITIYAKDKKTYNKVVKLIKKSGASSVKYKYKKKK